MRKLIDFLVFSNLYVAIPVMTLAWSTSILFGQEVDTRVLVFIYASTFFIYNLHRLVGLSQIPKDKLSARHIWSLKHRMFMYLSMGMAGALGLFLLFELGLPFFKALLPAAIVALGYSFPIIRKGGKFWRLRDLPFAKVFLISITVSYVTTYLPLYQTVFLDAFNLTLIGFAWARAFFILSITIPFDIRDIDFDKPSNLNTLPLLFGIEKSKTISLYALAFFAAMSFYLFQGNIYYSIALMLSAMATAWIVSYAKKDSSEYYFSLLVEGTMIIQFGLVFLVNELIG